jgi:hypothetical protein
LQITLFDLQDRTRIRDVVAMAIIVAMKEHDFEVGPKLKRAIDLVQSDLLRSLECLGVRNAEVIGRCSRIAAKPVVAIGAVEPTMRTMAGYSISSNAQPYRQTS